MTQLPRSYDVHGFPLHVQAESALLFDCAHGALGPFDPCSPDADPHVLRIRYGAAPRDGAHPDGLRRVGDCELPDGIRIVCYAGQDVQRIDLLDLASVEIDGAREETHITVAEGAEWCVTRGCVVPALCALLAERGMYMVHSATLRVDRGERSDAVLVAGSRGFGKTTTALALARAGMKLMGDDVCFATRRDDSSQRELTVWGLLLDCKVHRETLRMLPWLEEFPRRPAPTPDEYIVDARSELGVDRPAELAPAAIFFLDPRNEEAHRITPLAKLDAVTRLTRENVRAGDATYYAQSALAFRMLTDLAGGSETYVLSVGPDLDGLSGAILSALER